MVSKAYDVKELGQIIVEEAKKDGLTLAEEAVEKLAKASYVGMKRWASESAVVSENKIDDILMPAFNFLDPMVLPQIEKIDLDGDGK
jgi:hypothetical protein